MAEVPFRALLPADLDIADGVIEVLEQLEVGGWIARKVIDGRAIRCWPEGERHRQITVELTYPPNQHKLDFLREHTQLELLLSAKEEG